MPYATLPDRGLLVLSGKESLPFLQSLVSNDVLKLHEKGIAYAALLTPQGKFLHDFFVVSHGESVLLDVEKTRLADLQKRLMMYRLRSKVTIETMPDDFGVAVLWNESPPSFFQASIFPDPRLAQLGWRIYGTLSPAIATTEDYDAHRIALGIPVGGRDLIPDKSFLAQFGFEDLHGLDFTKGCYVGQEVTARAKHLGQVRKFIYQVKGLKNTLPAPGTPVYSDNVSSGGLLSVHGKTGLALLSVEAVEKARNAGKSFLCAGQPVEAILPSWVKNTPHTKT